MAASDSLSLDSKPKNVTCLRSLSTIFIVKKRKVLRTYGHPPQKSGSDADDQQFWTKDENFYCNALTTFYRIFRALKKTYNKKQKDFWFLAYHPRRRRTQKKDKK